jgi:hypothetical protein
MVIPRSRSAGRKSVVVLPVSTDPGVDMNDDFRRIDSVRVVFPESQSKNVSEARSNSMEQEQHTDVSTNS